MFNFNSLFDLNQTSAAGWSEFLGGNAHMHACDLQPNHQDPDPPGPGFDPRIDQFLVSARVWCSWTGSRSGSKSRSGSRTRTRTRSRSRSRSGGLQTTFIKKRGYCKDSARACFFFKSRCVFFSNFLPSIIDQKHLETSGSAADAQQPGHPFFLFSHAARALSLFNCFF